MVTTSFFLHNIEYVVSKSRKLMEKNCFCKNTLLEKKNRTLILLGVLLLGLSYPPKSLSWVPRPHGHITLSADSGIRPVVVHREQSWVTASVPRFPKPGHLLSV